MLREESKYSTRLLGRKRKEGKKETKSLYFETWEKGEEGDTGKTNKLPIRRKSDRDP